MIEVKNLTKRYGKQIALDHISFKIRNRKIYGLLGHHGAGKSTVLNILAGCLAADEGTVTVNGYDICEQSMDAKRQMGYLPENPPLFPDMTPYEYLTFVAEVKGVKGELVRRQVKEALTLTGVVPVADRMIRNLSKGYERRIGIAQALLGNPDIVLLDEPLEGLDPKQTMETRELIKRLGQTKTVVISGHVLAEISQICDHIIILDGGQVVADRDVEFTDIPNQSLESVFLNNAEESLPKEENDLYEEDSQQ